MGIAERFGGPQGSRLLKEALCKQILLGRDEAIIARIADAAEVIALEGGKTLFKDGDATNDIYFILAGSVSVQINGRQVTQRAAGQHVGEMATIDPSATRSASIIAIGEAALAKVSEENFSTIAADHPELWRHLAAELADRLRQRRRDIPNKNEIPRIFIASSAEARHVAQAVQLSFHHDNVIPVVWTDAGFFQASNATLEDLEKQIASSDFGIVVLSNDDVVVSRDKEQFGPRDNAVLELGMLMGGIGRKRTFFLVPHDITVKIPSDLTGLKPLTYKATQTPIGTAVAPACTEIREVIQRLGPK